MKIKRLDSYGKRFEITNVRKEHDEKPVSFIDVIVSYLKSIYEVVEYHEERK